MLTLLCVSGEPGKDGGTADCSIQQVSVARCSISKTCSIPMVTLCQHHDSTLSDLLTPSPAHLGSDDATSFVWLVFLPSSLPLPLCLSSGMFSLRTMISLLEYILTTVECHAHLHPHTPLLPSFNCVQSNLSEIPNLTCSGSAQVQTPQMTHKSVCDLPFAYILVCGLPNFIVFI